MDLLRVLAVAAGAAMVMTGVATAQDTTTPAAAAAPADAAALLTPEELQALAAPVALYPDTLLIQVLVAATYPLQVVKANEYLKAHEGADPKSLEADIAAQGWDESVAVLATAFPSLITRMADNIEWTDQMGNAMLAQSEDVLDAVQVLRKQASDAGTLTSNDQQTVEVTQQGDAGDTIIIQPANPEVVYVPQYDPEVVYVDNGSDAGDAVAAGLIAFGTFVILDEIFDNDDPWNDYWGCRNCGGWNGRPIINNPDIDIDIDRGDINIGDRNNIGWKPDEVRRDGARDQIANRRPGQVATLPAGSNRGDQMRQNLTARTGATDIARDRGAADRVAGQVGAGQLNRPQGGAARVDRPGGLGQSDRANVAAQTRAQPARGAGAAAARPAPTRPATAKAPQRKAAPSKGAAMQRTGSASRTHAASNRGRSSAGGRGGGGRGGGRGR